MNAGRILTTDIQIDNYAYEVNVEMPEMQEHDHHELYFQIAGERRYLIGDSVYHVMPGDIVAIAKGTLHRTTYCRSADRGITYSRYLICFHEEYVQDFIGYVGREAFDSLMSSGCMQLPPEQLQRVHAAVMQMEQEQSSSDPVSGAMTRHLLHDVLLTLMRYGVKKKQSLGIYAEKIQEVTRYISENYAEEITLESMAKMAIMEKTYFSKNFKKLTGVGFQEYLTHTRIKAAQQLLSVTDLPVGEISGRCGFSSGNYFADTFRSRTGMSPTAYRRKMRG